MISKRHKTLGLSFLLFLLNIWLIHELFTVEFLDQMGSIEGAYIGISRFAMNHWRDLAWFPLWYGGVPYQNTYPPLLHLLVAGTAVLLRTSPALAYHAVTAVFYSLGPVTLFWLALRLSGSCAYSFGAGLFYSLAPASAFLIRAVRYDVGGLWRPRRLHVLVRYGEGPHVAALALLPLAWLLVVVAFEKRRPVWWVLAAMGLASVVLTNWIGGAALGATVIAWLLARREGDWWKNCLIVSAVAIYAYALASPWVPPSTVLAIQAGERYVRPALSSVLSRGICATLAVLMVVLLLWLFRRCRTPSHVRSAIFFLLPTALVTLASEWLGIHLVPQPWRYHLEMDMGVALVLAFAAQLLLARVRPRVRAVIACVLLALCVVPVLRSRKYARRLIRPVEIRSTIEYREAEWLGPNAAGRRVLVPGSISFWLNAFTDTPQFSGGFVPGVINAVYPAAHYQVLSGEGAGAHEGEIALLWLKAFGVGAVAVSGPRSREIYKDFRNPQKFEGLLPVLWREGDDTIYEVPRRSPSLANVIRKSDLPARAPSGGLDLDAIRPYVAALENPAYPLAQMDWLNNHSALISASMAKDQVLSVQISYHPGWSATVNGQPRRVYGDNLGQLVVEPECEGPCKVEVAYDGGLEMRLARVVSWGGLLGGLGWILIDWRKRSARPA